MLCSRLTPGRSGGTGRGWGWGAGAGRAGGGGVGTRAAMVAPGWNLGLVAVWDDGDASHSDDRAPFPHVREVLELRASRDKCAFLLGGWSCTVEAAQLVETGWAAPLVADREQVRATAPLVRTVGDADLARDEAPRGARPEQKSVGEGKRADLRGRRVI